MSRASTPSSPALIDNQQVLAKFGARPSEMMVYLAPDRTQQLIRSYNIRTAKDAYLKDSISLAKLRKVYGGESVRMLLAIWINNLVEYSGCGVKQSDEAFYEVAELAYRECYFLGVSELALFFNRCKCGHYGTFFGRFEPMKLLSWLDDYLEDRRASVASVRQDEERTRKAQYAQKVKEMLRLDPSHYSEARNVHRARGVSELVNQMLPPPNKNQNE